MKSAAPPLSLIGLGCMQQAPRLLPAVKDLVLGGCQPRHQKSVIVCLVFC